MAALKATIFCIFRLKGRFNFHLAPKRYYSLNIFNLSVMDLANSTASFQLRKKLFKRDAWERIQK